MGRVLRGVVDGGLLFVGVPRYIGLFEAGKIFHQWQRLGFIYVVVVGGK